MRHEFSESIYKVFQEQPQHMMLSGDLGHGVLDPIRKHLPKQFLNMGVSEPHMISFACGLALHQHPTWIYSMPSFTILRCAEALRNLICEASIPLKIVASGAAFSYGRMGSSHHAIEDIAVLKSLGEVQIYLPAQAQDVTACVHKMAVETKPSYLRLISQQLALTLPPFAPLRLIPTLKPCSNLIVSFGGALRFFPKWQQHHVAVIGSYPLDPEEMMKLQEFIRTNRIQRIVTLEEHLVRGGLGESLHRDLEDASVQWKHLGLRHSHDKDLGDGDVMCMRLGLSPDLLDSLIG